MFGGKEWMIETNVMINNPYGSSEMNLHFFSNKDVFIMSFATTSKEDVFYNPDIRCVSMWAQENGWNIPQPSPDLIGDNLNFWKHFWETGLINSKYLDKKYGKK
jgi:predicted nicotinamide N-methyase